MASLTILCSQVGGNHRLIAFLLWHLFHLIICCKRVFSFQPNFHITNYSLPNLFPIFQHTRTVPLLYFKWSTKSLTCIILIHMKYHLHIDSCKYTFLNYHQINIWLNRGNARHINGERKVVLDASNWKLLKQSSHLGLGCHNILTPARTPRLGLSQHTDTSKNTKTWAVTTHWHQQEHQGLGYVTNTLTPVRTPRLH